MTEFTEEVLALSNEIRTVVIEDLQDGGLRDIEKEALIKNKEYLETLVKAVAEEVREKMPALRVELNYSLGILNYSERNLKVLALKDIEPIMNLVPNFIRNTSFYKVRHIQEHLVSDRPASNIHLAYELVVLLTIGDCVLMQSVYGITYEEELPRPNIFIKPETETKHSEKRPMRLIAKPNVSSKNAIANYVLTSDLLSNIAVTK